MLTDYQAYAALRIGLTRLRSPRERIKLVAKFLDALESDYLASYPTQPPVFKEGMEKEVVTQISQISQIKLNRADYYGGV